MTINIKGYDVLIDDEDFEKISQYKWSLIKSTLQNIYFSNTITIISQNKKLNIKRKQKTILLHRLVMNCPDNKQIDHINGDTLDNRKYNLRICTNIENSRNQKKHRDNKSGYKGVSWDKTRRKWQVRIYINKRQVNLGRFVMPELAYKVYCEAAKKYYGEFARLD